ncbi:hypothetical protein [Aurantiacibacter suaedae]|uniref:hypothetical protein n=1 Tax=Aurantiacibacter suaedae TaxID=2545755 RepID=UPI0010F56FEB|nr:hypothetical protein [Aurantiacibacter suaedae]
MSVAGTYEFAVNTPMGAQSGTMTVVPDASGTAFTGTIDGSLGHIEVDDGTIVGDTLTWSMRMSSPMPVGLDCEAVVSGDTVEGKVRAGIFGTMSLTGRKIA